MLFILHTFLVELLESKIGFEDNKQAEIHITQSFLQSGSQNMKDSTNQFNFLEWTFQSFSIKNLSELSNVVIFVNKFIGTFFWVWILDRPCVENTAIAFAKRAIDTVSTK